MAPRDDDDDIPTRVGGAPPGRPQSQPPIPLGGSVPVPEIDFENLAVSQARVSAATSSPATRKVKIEEEPIPLLDGDDLLDVDAETTPGIPIGSISPSSAPKPGGLDFAMPVPLPMPAPAPSTAPAFSPLPTPVATPSPPKTPSFLDEVPTAPRASSPHDQPTRFNRTFNQNDLPAPSAPAAPASAKAIKSFADEDTAVSLPGSDTSMSERTVPIQASDLDLAKLTATAPEDAAHTEKTMPVQTTRFAFGKNGPPQPPPELSMPPNFEGSLDLSAPPPPDDLPTAYEPLPNFADTASAPSADYGGIELASDFPGPLPSAATSPEFPADLPATYTGTPYTTSGYQSANADNSRSADAQLPDDFGSELPPLSSFDGLPSELPPSSPSEMPPDFANELPPPVSSAGDLGIELDHDLPSPAASYGGGMMESGVVLSDDLPTPSTGGDGSDTLALDLPAPRALGPESQHSVPQLMDTAATQRRPALDGTADEDTVVVREKRKKKADDAAPTSTGGKRRVLMIAAPLGALVVGIAVLAIGYPELLPWAKDVGPAATKDGVENAAGTPATAAADKKEPNKDKANQDAKSPTGDGHEPAAPELAAIPELTAANVNHLDYFALREATKTLSASGKASASRDVLQWARLRMAYFYGDSQAREALLADAPTLSAQASELTAAAAVGVQLLQNKAALAKKNAERLVGGPGPKVKGRFKDSVPMLTVLAAATDKPPARALQLYERVIAADPLALDARVGRILVLLQSPQPGQRAQAISAAAALVKSQPSAALSVKLGRAINAVENGSSAMADITAPLTMIEQTSEIPTGMNASFLRLLAHRAAITGDFALAKRAAERTSSASPEDTALAMTLARITAAAGEDPAGVLLEARGRVRDVEAKASLVDEQVKLAVARKDLAAAKKALALQGDLAPRAAMPFARLGEARIALAEGKHEGAQRAANAALKARPKTFEARLIALTASKLPAPAELAQLTALAKLASNADIDAHLAKAMADRTNNGGAAELYARALWREPIVSDPVSVTLALADAFDRAGNGDRAECLLADLRSNVPTDERLGTALLAHARRHGKGGVAIEYFQAASAKNPTDTGIKLQLARALVEADRSPEAQTMLDALAHTESGAKSPDVLRELARAWMSRDTVKARGFVNDAIRLKPDASSYALLGEIEESQNKLDDAMDAYRKAIKLDSSLTEARVRLARSQVQRGQWQDAATQLRDIVQHDPSNVQAMELLGDAMRDLGKPRDALVWYKKALDVTPESATLMMKFARLQLQDLAAVQPAVKSFRQILQVHPELAEAHYYLGYALKDLGRTGEAKSELEQYLKARPEGEFAAEVKNDLQDLASQ